MARIGWLALGCLCAGLGIIGAVVPLMPTTIFLILATGCFARSSPRLERWLLGHPRFIATLTAWQAERAIGPRAKAAACSGMVLGFALFWIGARPGLLMASIVAGVMAGCAAYILSRPTSKRAP